MTKPTVTMPLSKALYILADVHTREDDQTGFVVIAGLGPHSPLNRWDPGDYMRAWEAVRAACHMQIRPGSMNEKPHANEP